jgi:hypothetical protein
LLVLFLTTCSSHHIEESCPYRTRCLEFVVQNFETVRLRFEDSRTARCFCSSCYSGPPTHQCGQPPFPCVVPVGCVRIALKTHESVMRQEGVATSYYACYHGTSIAKAVSIIRSAQLLRFGTLAHTGMEVTQPFGHISDGTSILVPARTQSKIGSKFALVSPRPAKLPAGAMVFNPSSCFFTTPSLRYALAYSPHMGINTHVVQVCLEMRQDPNSINVLESTLDCDIIIKDPLVPQDEIEWFTQRQFPAIVPVALLVKIYANEGTCRCSHTHYPILRFDML